MSIRVRLGIVFFFVIIYIIIANLLISKKDPDKDFLSTISNKRVEIVGEIVSFPKTIKDNQISFLIKTKTIHNNIIKKRTKLLRIR